MRDSGVAGFGVSSEHVVVFPVVSGQPMTRPSRWLGMLRTARVPHTVLVAPQASVSPVPGWRMAKVASTSTALVESKSRRRGLTDWSAPGLCRAMVRLSGSGEMVVVDSIWAPGVLARRLSIPTWPCKGSSPSPDCALAMKPSAVWSNDSRRMRSTRAEMSCSGPAVPPGTCWKLMNWRSVEANGTSLTGVAA